MKKFVIFVFLILFGLIGFAGNIYDYVPGGTEFVLGINNVDPVLEAVEGLMTSIGGGSVDEEIQGIMNMAKGAEIILFGNSSLALVSSIMDSDFDIDDEESIIHLLLSQDLMIVNNVFDAEFIDNFIQNTVKPLLESIGKFESEEITMQDYPIMIYRVLVNGVEGNIYLLQDGDYSILSTDEHLMRKSMNAKELENKRLSANYSFFKELVEEEGVITFMNRGLQVSNLFLKAADIIYGFPRAEALIISIDKDMNLNLNLFTDIEYDSNIDSIYTINTARNIAEIEKIPAPEGFDVLLSTGKISFSPEKILDFLDNIDPLDDALDMVENIPNVEILMQIIPLFLEVANYPEIWLDTTGDNDLEVFFKTADVQKAIEELSEALGSEADLTDGIYFLSDGSAYISAKEGGTWLEIGSPIPDNKPLFEYSPSLSEKYPEFTGNLKEIYASIFSLIFADNYGNGVIGFDNEGDFRIDLNLNLAKLLEMYLTISSSISSFDDFDIDEVTGNEEVFNIIVNGELDALKNKVNEGFDAESVVDDWNMETALHVAIVYDQMEIAKYLLEDLWVNPDPLNYYGQTPLYLAVTNGYYDLTKLLLDNQADPNIGDDYGEVPLYIAQIYGYDDIAQLLKDYGAEEVQLSEIEEVFNIVSIGDLASFKNKINEGFDPETVIDDWNMETALHVAIVYDQFEIAKYLLEDLMVNPDQLNYYSQTPLMLAASYGDYDFCELLLKNGADPNLQDDFGEGALYQATVYGYNDVADLLKEYGAEEIEIDISEDSDNVYNLITSGDLDSLKEKINEGFDPESIIDEWFSEKPLHVAAGNYQYEIAKYLLEDLWVDPDPLNVDGQTPLFLAVMYGDYEMVKLLLDNWADPNIVDIYDVSALYNAKTYGYEDIAQLLIEYGAEEEDITINTDDISYIIQNGTLEEFKEAILDKDPNYLVDEWPGDTLLISVARYGTTEMAQYLLDIGADIEMRNQDLENPILVASYNGNYDMVEFLINNGAEPDVIDLYGYTPLSNAYYSYDEDMIELLLKNGADPDIEDENYDRLLFDAVYNGEKDVVDLLLFYGADVNKANSYGETPIMIAESYGYEDITKVLMDYGAESQAGLVESFEIGDLDLIKELVEEGKINEKINNQTPIYLATFYYQPELVEYLVENGADLNILSGENDDPPIFNVVDLGDIEMLEYLLQNGADVNISNYNGVTALLLAASYSDRAVYDLLVSYDADENAKDSTGNMALSYVIYFAEEGYLEFAKYLIDKGAVFDINAVSDYGETPLYWALSAANYEGADFLLDNGADINIKDSTGSTLLHIAVENNDIDAVKYLIDSGAEPDLENDWGETPLQVAEAYGFTDILEYLKAMGIE